MALVTEPTRSLRTSTGPASVERVLLDPVGAVAPATDDRLDLLLEDLFGLHIQLTAERVVMELLAANGVDDIEPGPVATVCTSIGHGGSVPTPP